MNLGLTLLFTESNNSLSGILKSMVVELDINNFKTEIEKTGNKIAKHYDYKFIGVNDIFVVSGRIEHGQILGRTTYYEFDNTEKAKTLKYKFPYFQNNNNNNNEKCFFYCSLIFFGENKFKENYTVTVSTIVESEYNKLEKVIESTAKSKIFKNNITYISIDGLSKLEFIGVEYCNETYLKFNVFETLYSDFDNSKLLNKEILSEKSINKKLKDILIEN